MTKPQDWPDLRHIPDRYPHGLFRYMKPRANSAKTNQSCARERILTNPPSTKTKDIRLRLWWRVLQKISLRHKSLRFDINGWIVKYSPVVMCLVLATYNKEKMAYQTLASTIERAGIR